MREKRLFLRQKKSTTFFHARISRSGKGRVSDFSATRVRVEGVGVGSSVKKKVLFLTLELLFFTLEKSPDKQDSDM
jgi:hypothetical protein